MGITQYTSIMNYFIQNNLSMYHVFDLLLDAVVVVDYTSTSKSGAICGARTIVS